MLKRLFDITASGIGLILLSPIFLVIAIWIKLDSEGPVFYRQVRVGRGNKDFRIFKFRSMRVGSDKGSLITIGGRDPRITKSGYFIRRFKLDEFPQLINVLLGDMSLVGPRPEVRHYVDMYNERQMHVLDVRPGITDYASIKYRNENELLDGADDPEAMYVNKIMPDKLEINLDYVERSSFFYDFAIIFQTVWSLSVMKFIKSIIKWYFGKDTLPYWCILALDSSILLVCFFFSYYCVLGGDGVVENFWQKLFYVLLCIILYLVGYKWFHTYSNIIRYSSFVDLRNIIYSNLIGTCAVLIIRCFVDDTLGELFPGLRVTIYTFAFSTLSMCTWRMLVKYAYEISFERTDEKNIVIYGVKDAAVSIAKSIRNNKISEYQVVGFIAPKGDEYVHFLCGVPVFYDDEKLMRNLQRKRVDGVMVSPLQSDNFRNNEQLVNQLTEKGVQVFMVPDIITWDRAKNANYAMLNKVEIEQLLPRNQIEIDMAAIGGMLSDKRILITGAAGSIGSEMVRQISQFNPKSLVLIDQAETPMHDIRMMMAKTYPDINASTIVTSITKKERMEQIFKEFRPEYVFHAAAYKHVPMMEDNPSEAVQNNIYGTRVIADLAVKYGAKKFVMISTDKAVNPTNVMGCSKRICEIYCQSLNKAIVDGSCPIKSVDAAGNEVKSCTQFVTTRFGNVLGSNGSVIPIFKEQIRNGGPVTVTHPEIVRYFMLIPEACKLVLEAGTFGKGGEIFVFDMGKPVKIADLAKRMIALSGVKNVKVVFTGLRDGEKLYEEVLDSAEVTIPTKNPKIRIAKVRESPYDVACQNEDRLLKASYTFDDMAVVKIMKDIVPEFKSNHSKFTKLD